LRRQERSIDLLLDHHDGPDGGHWLPRSAVISRAFDLNAGAEQVRRAHHAIVGGFAGWPASPPDTMQVSKESATAVVRYTIRHDLYHAARAGLPEKVMEHVTDLAYLERRLRLDGPDHLIASLEEAQRLMFGSAKG
jgi:hypothetical protein